MEWRLMYGQRNRLSHKKKQKEKGKVQYKGRIKMAIAVTFLPFFVLGGHPGAPFIGELVKIFFFGFLSPNPNRNKCRP